MLDFIFPRKCVGCGTKLRRAEVVLCSECRARFETESRAPCPICRRRHLDCRCATDADGADIPTNGYFGAETTSHAERSGPHLTLHLSEYTSDKKTITDKLILAAKNGANRALTRFMAERLCELLLDELPSDKSAVLVTNVPRRRSAINEFGCDQAAELAKALSKRLGVNYIDALTRTGDTEQKGLSKAERLQNALSGYKLRHKHRSAISGTTVVLADDIITTGATMRVCADLLAESGAVRIICLSFGRKYKGKN